MTTNGHDARLKVLFLSGLQLHPTRSGGTLRSFALVNALARQGLDVRVHSLTGRRADYLARRPSSAQIWPEGVEESVERGLVSAVDWLGGYVSAPAPVWIAARLAAVAASPGERLLSRSLREKVAWCDALVADFPFCAPILEAPSARRKLRVLSTHNVEHHLFDGRRGWRQRLMRASVRRLEIRAAAACDVLVACCAEDARFFEANTTVRQTVVVPNGTDTRRFEGIEAQRDAARRDLGIEPTVKLLLFTASKWGPNREAFEYLLAFAKSHAPFLAAQGIHFLVVGNVVAAPLRVPGFTATGRVERVEPFFAAADAAINPLLSGAGTNVKMCEFIAARLPILTTAFGARGFRLDGETVLLFARDELRAALTRLRHLLERDPARVRRMAAEAYARNQGVVDMDACIRPLVDALSGLREPTSTPGRTALSGTRPPAA